MSFRKIRKWFNSDHVEADSGVLLISGFGWSGSGAVIDFAMDFSGVETFRKNAEESSILKGTYSLASIFRNVARGSPVPLSDIERVAAAFRGVPGSADEVDPPREYINFKRNEHMRREFGAERVDAAVDRFLAECKGCSEGASRNFNGSMHDLLRIGRGLIQDLVRCSMEARLKEKPDFLIVNNDPPGYSVDLFTFLPQARYTVVTRDLVDVFADLVRLGRVADTEVEARRFCNAQIKKIERYSEAYQACSRAMTNRIFVVEFADFVSSAAVRADWKAFAGIDGVVRSNRFQPDVSVKNVGIGEQLSDKVRSIILDKVESMRREMMVEHQARNAGHA